MKDQDVTTAYAAPGPAAALRDRVAHGSGAGVVVLPAEVAPLIRVALPVRGRRRRLAALPFALEESLGQPIEGIHCALHPARTGGDALAAVVRHDAMPEGNSPVLSEAALLPAPDGGDGPAWLVWQEGGRAVIRASDGSGFAAASDALAVLWSAAGRPALRVHGDAPMPGLPARHEPGPPPDADPSDLRFDLRQGLHARDARHWAVTARIAAAAAGLGVLGHFGLAFADRAALDRVARAEAAAVDARLADRLPGATTALGSQALLARLAPRPPAPERSAFLPLLTRVAGALAGAPPLAMRRVVWDGEGGALAMEVGAASLEDLQAAEAALSAAGLTVALGTATAAAGEARAELRVGPGA